MKKLKYGVGINDADYQTSTYSIVKNPDGTRTFSLEWRCPFYKKWEVEDLRLKQKLKSMYKNQEHK